MRIASVEVLAVGNELTGQHTLVRLETDGGISGLGQSACWGYPRGVAGVLDELTPLLIGLDPFRIEHIWHLAYRARPFRSNLLCRRGLGDRSGAVGHQGQGARAAGLGAARRSHARPGATACAGRRRDAG